MNKTKNRYCIYCGYKISNNDSKCPKCLKKVNSRDNIFFHYLKEKIKDELKGGVKDSFFSTLTNFIKSHLYGTILTLSICITIIGSNVILNNQDNYVEYTSEKPTISSANTETKSENQMFLDFASLYFEALENQDTTVLNSYLLKDKIPELGYVPDYELTDHINLFYAKRETLLNTKDTPAYCAYHEGDVESIRETYQAVGREIYSNDLLYINIRTRLKELGYSTYSCLYRFEYCMESEHCTADDHDLALSIGVRIMFVNYNNKIYVADEVVIRDNYVWIDVTKDFDYINMFYRNGGDAVELRKEIARSGFQN